MKEWYTPAELADLNLPDLPTSKSALSERVKREGWRQARKADRRPAARPRRGRGGGWEYHVSLLPAAAFNTLERRERGIFRHIVSRTVRWWARVRP